ncbi:holin family protein [Roseicyclus sp. F158]|uniref:Holin family protein n=1 Tax=Tropicimonas omnivorans TaxID=3075590 RepID=A0ABU3DJ13_9RHOB|nr:holin family protein [Roseicyclus sp. F158]MDT0683722.1 holin family protein [Roseicyclus sp. F158]
MGLIDGLFSLLFSGGRNAVKETVEVFRENAEAGAARDADRAEAALAQFAAEFSAPRQSVFDRVIDGLNRLPRPALALGTLGLFVSAMVDPVWFAERMQGIALVPEPLWWLMGAIVSFYFGARHQAKSQSFQRSIAQTVALAPSVVRNTAALRALGAGAGEEEVVDGAGDVPSANPALAEWRSR